MIQSLSIIQFSYNPILFIHNIYEQVGNIPAYLNYSIQISISRKHWLRNKPCQDHIHMYSQDTSKNITTLEYFTISSMSLCFRIYHVHNVSCAQMFHVQIIFMYPCYPTLCNISNIIQICYFMCLTSCYDYMSFTLSSLFYLSLDKLQVIMHGISYVTCTIRVVLVFLIYYHVTHTQFSHVSCYSVKLV